MFLSGKADSSKLDEDFLGEIFERVSVVLLPYIYACVGKNTSRCLNKCLRGHKVAVNSRSEGLLEPLACCYKFGVILITELYSHWLLE